MSKLEACEVKMDESVKRILAVDFVEAYDEKVAEEMTRKEEMGTMGEVMEAAREAERTVEGEERKLRCMSSKVRGE